VGTVVLVLRLGLAAVFATAGVGKLLDREGSRQALAGFGVPRRALRAGAILLPVFELATAAALIFPPSALWGAAAALALLLAFIVGIAIALSRGQAPDCHCFGQLHSAPAGRGTLARNAALAALAIVVLAAGPGPAIDSWIADRTGAELAAVGLGLAALGLAWVALQLRLQNARLRTELAEAQAGLPEVGLPVGAPAPEFSLRGLDGEKVSLSSLCARGNPIAIIFVGPTCGPCWMALPFLRRFQDTLAHQLTIVMISSGTAAENEDAIVSHDITGIFLHDGFKAMQAYRARVTPSAVMVTPDGRIATTMVEGSRPIEPMIRLTLNGGLSAMTADGSSVVQPPAA
jgi:uncharacterized membrane protein YphA (DoxX/SURF4 family)/peroxiredoxin